MHTRIHTCIHAYMAGEKKQLKTEPEPFCGVDLVVVVHTHPPPPPPPPPHHHHHHQHHHHHHHHHHYHHHHHHQINSNKCNNYIVTLQQTGRETKNEINKFRISHVFVNL